MSPSSDQAEVVRLAAERAAAERAAAEREAAEREAAEREAAERATAERAAGEERATAERAAERVVVPLQPPLSLQSLYPDVSESLWGEMEGARLSRNPMEEIIKLGATRAEHLRVRVILKIAMNQMGFVKKL